MTTCTVTPTVAPAFNSPWLNAVVQYFSRSVVTRESVDQAWIDSGLHRLDAATLKDVGAPSGFLEGMTQREAWKLAAALDATRHL